MARLPRSRARFAGWCLLAFGTLSCRQAPPKPPPQFERFGNALEEMEKRGEEWGGASVSSPLLSKPSNAFKFELTKVTPDTLFDQAKSELQGRMGALAERSQAFGLGVGVQLDPTQAAAYEAQVAEYQRGQAARQTAQAAEAERREILRQAAYDDFDAAVLAAQKEEDPVKSKEQLAAARRKLAEALPKIDAAAPAYPVATGDLPALPTTLAAPPAEAKSRLAADRFLGAQGLFTSSPPLTSSNRTALLTASGDNATLALLRVLGDPERIADFQRKVVLFGVSSVAVNPGWRTRKGYSASVTVATHYGYEEAARDVVASFVGETSVPLVLRDAVAVAYGMDRPSLPAGVTFDPAQAASVCQKFSKDSRYRKIDDPHVTPTVSAITPFTEAQNLQLESSERRQTELALGLAFALRSAGLGAQAQAFEQFVSSRQRDAATRTANVAVNTFSMSGGLFGYEIGPRLVGVDRKDDGATEVLERQSFPSLVVFGFDQSDVHIAVEGNTWEPESGTTTACKLSVPHLELVTTTSWLPLRKSGERFTVEERLGLAYELAAAESELEAAARNVEKSPLKDGFMRTLRLAEARAHAIRFRLNGSQSATPVEIPPELLFPGKKPKEKPAAKLVAIAPSEIVLERDLSGAAKSADIDFVLGGSGLDQLNLAGGVKMVLGKGTVRSTEAAGDAIVIHASITDATTPALAFELAQKDSKLQPLRTSLVPVRLAPQSQLRVIRRVTGAAADRSKQTTDTIEFERDIPESVVRAEIEKRKQAAPESDGGSKK